MLCSAIIFATTLLVAGFPGNQARVLRNRSAQYKWPVECEGRTYCDTKPSYYPDEAFARLLNPAIPAFNVSGGVESRDGDVACIGKRYPRIIYLIKDSNDDIRFVAQTHKFEIKLVVEECTEPGRVHDAAGKLSISMLKRHRVECVETLVSLGFPVLSLDGDTLELVEPRGGIPLSCSAKVMNN